MSNAIWTIGHSNRDFDTFSRLLTEHAIERLADVRRFPGSRKHPQFNQDELRRRLAEAGIDYQHFPALGGRRGKPAADSRNTAWQVAAFNAYADYLATPEFAAALETLIEAAADRPTAMMCAEALPWRCHRRLISDALIVRGWQVWDIMSPGKARPHALTPFARVEAGELIYPGGTLLSD